MQARAVDQRGMHEHDTGLRFIPTDDPAVFLCPNCNSKAYDPDRMET